MLPLKPDEAILKKERATCKAAPTLIRIGGIYQDKYKPVKGFLILTSRRLVFNYEQGLFSKKKGTLLELPLRMIHNIFIERNFLSERLVVEYATSGKLRQASFEIANPNAWKTSIKRVLLKRETNEKQENVKTPTSSMKRAHTQKKIVVVREIVKIRCRYCKALVEITARTCPDCGAHL